LILNKLTTNIQECKISLDNIIFNVNEAYSNITYGIKNLDSGDTLFNITAYYAVDIIKMMVYTELNIQKDKNDRNYDRKLLKTSTNICKLSQGVLGDFIAKIIMKDIHEIIDFDLNCPFKKVRIKFSSF
jgi:hypothetical protein